MRTQYFIVLISKQANQWYHCEFNLVGLIVINMDLSLAVTKNMFLYFFDVPKNPFVYSYL
jgi:hypothetical protein